MAGTKKQGASGSRRKEPVTIADFHEMLVLAKWAYGIINKATFENLSTELRKTEHEGFADGDTRTKFSHVILDNSLFYLGDATKCTEEQLIQYDLNIVQHWKQITAERNKREGIVYTLKYYQYLTLLVTELYLDWYFNRRAQLLTELNAEIVKYNARLNIKEELPLLEEKDLNKLSFWEATGSGKTLMLNVNILQYRHWSPDKPDHVMLLTPDEGLTDQHLADLALSKIPSFRIEKDAGLWTQKGVGAVGVIDAGKLISDKSTKTKGEKSFKAEEFSGKNLVLVDEGHNGHSSEQGERRRIREQLCDGGFSFEYSATFGQAVAKSAGKDGVGLRAHYARNILFDYSYKYFYADEYGKNSFILNMQDDQDEESVFEYLVANLLKFVQQHEIFRREKATMAEFLIEKPLCLFVGNTVTGKKGNEKETLSDVCEVVKLFARVLSSEDEGKKKVEKLFTDFIDNKPRLKSKQGTNILERAFDPMMGFCGNNKGKEAYRLMQEHVFNAPAGTTALLTVTHRKAPDEIALSVGAADPFAVIHIGDTAGFLKQVREMPGLDVQENPFEGSLFDTVNERTSTVNFLVGSRKFTQGWSCWRVSAMGLLNMGVTEGTQIIQLFGRGVRLKGKGYSLKRSNTRPGDVCQRPAGSLLEKLETLNIFGLHADYMPKFREYLNEEGVHSQDEIITIEFPVRKRSGLPKLEVCDVPEEYKLRGEKGFCRMEAPVLFDWKGDLKDIPRVLHEDFSYLQRLQKGTTEVESDVNVKKPVYLPEQALPFLDYDRLFLRLMEAKAQRGYWNLEISKAQLEAFVKFKGTAWYTLYARDEDVTFDSFDKLSKIQSLCETLLVGYMESFYKACQGVYEAQHRQRILLDLDKAMKAYPDGKYHFDLTVEKDAGGIWKTKLETLKKYVEDGMVPAEVNNWSTNDVIALVFETPMHGCRRELLIEPVMWKDKKSTVPFEIRPVTFDSPSELLFLQDLIKFYEDPANQQYFADVDLYLMRNAAKKSQGIGFDEAGGFYPDFLLWLVDKQTGQQYLTFVDPKGFEHKVDKGKLELYKTLKEIQDKLNAGKPDKLILNSVLLSYTDYRPDLFDHNTMQELEHKHILFMKPLKTTPRDLSYLPKLFSLSRKEHLT